jgi:hypothetical protein
MIRAAAQRFENIRTATEAIAPNAARIFPD